MTVLLLCYHSVAPSRKTRVLVLFVIFVGLYQLFDIYVDLRKIPFMLRQSFL